MKLSYYGRLAYARTIAGAVNLTLVETSKVQTPCTDGVTMWVPRYDTEWEEDCEEEVLWWGKLVHETYHNDRTRGHNLAFRLLKERVAAWKKEGKKPSHLWKTANNLLEDLRIEKREFGNFPGQDRIMANLRGMMLREARDFIKKKSSREDALFLAQWLGFAKWNPGVIGEPVLTWTSDTVVTDAWAKIEDLMPRIYAMDRVEEPFELADEICRRLTEDDEDGGGEDKGATVSESSSEGETKDGSEDSESEEGESKEGKGKKEGAAGYLVHDHSIPPPNAGLPKPNEAVWKYEPSPHSGGFPGIPMREIKSTELKHGNSYGMTKILDNVRTQGLASQIKKRLQVLSARRYEGGHKRGKLDTGALWKGRVYRNTETGKRVFKETADVLSLDCAVTLLVDQSGSMSSRSKITYASAAACALNEVFDRIGVKCRVAGFTDTLDETINYLHKDFNDKVQTPELARRMANSAVDIMSGNADGENILWEYEKLVVRTEKRKVFIVLSDGMPADSKGKYNVTQYTKNVISNIEKAGKVHIIGVGILDGSVEYFYRSNELISDASKIEEVVLRLLEKEILRHA